MGYPSLKTEEEKKQSRSLPLRPGRATAPAGHPPLGNRRFRPHNVLREETPSPSSNPLEAKGRSVRGRKPGDSTYLVETTRASHLPRNQDVMPSTPNPEKEEEGGMISSDADIPDSIARAVLGALQEKRTGNNLLSTIISIARVRASQLQQCLLTGREPSKGTIQATLDLISLAQEPSGRTNLADKVSTVSYTRVYFESTEYHYCTCTDKQQ